MFLLFVVIVEGLTDLQPLKKRKSGNSPQKKIHVHIQAKTEGMCPSASNTH